MPGQTTQQFQWSFPGGAWGLGVVLVVGVILIALSYRLALVRLPRAARLLLSLLLLVAFILILACLCRPTIVRETRSEPDDKPKVAVVFDESGSMDVKSLWGHSRRDRALWYWDNQISKQDEHYDLHTYAFAESLRATDKPGEPPPPSPTSRGGANRPGKPLPTHLYRNLAEWSDQFATQGYDAVICLTDGVDTSDALPNEALDALHQTPLPHAFVAFTTPLPSVPHVDITKLEVASTAQVGTKVPVNMLVQASGLAAGKPLRVTVRQDKRVVHRDEFSLPAHRSITWAIDFEVSVVNAQTLVYEVLVESGDDTLASATWSVQGLSEEKPTVLLYQGAPDWGTRHLRGVFDRAENAEMTVRFAADALPDLYGRRRSEDNFPGPTELSRHNVVILLNVNRGQITPRMESTLTEFVRDGGGLLVLSANPSYAASLRGSGLEALLPVEFGAALLSERRVPPKPLDKWQETVKRGGAAHLRSEIHRANQWPESIVMGLPEHSAPALRPVTLTREGIESPIFNLTVRDGRPESGNLPLFETLATVRQAKGGARVLATDGKSRIVLAVQQFGHGRSAVLATDTLWRWRLSLDSKSYVFDKFWRQLVGYMAGGARREPAWLLESAVCAPHEAVNVRFFLPETARFTLGELAFAAESPDETIELTLVPADQDEVYQTTLAPKPKTTYRLVARHQGQVVAETFLTGRADLTGQELRALKADPVTLEELAAAGGGVVVDPDRSFDWPRWLPRRPEELIRTERTPLWHSPWIFAALLGLFLAELLIRRRHRMV